MEFFFTVFMVICSMGGGMFLFHLSDRQSSAEAAFGYALCGVGWAAVCLCIAFFKTFPQ